MDIIRPAASEESLAVPTIVIPSPYYEEAWGVGRARDFKPDPNGPIDHFPQYYDNFFVPRGYAVALVEHRLTWEIMTDDYVFEAGHRIGIVLSGIGQGARAPHTASDITVHLNGSHVQLPIVGGPPALRAATR